MMKGSVVKMTKENAINRLKFLREHYKKEGGYLSIANVVALDIAINTLKSLDEDDLLNFETLKHTLLEED